ncbi:MAG: rhodanese-like domain-containing protein [Phycisphaerae bacterium]
MAKHAARFLDIVNEAKSRIQEVTVSDVQSRLEANEEFFLVDVREESEYAAGHLPKALHLSKGIIERDIEAIIPNIQAQIILYCGGGFRSALAAENLRRMGYESVFSMDGGYRGWREAGHSIVHEE